MTIAEDDVIRATAVMKRALSDDIQNVFHLKLINISTATQLQLRTDIAEYLEDIWGTLVGLMHTSITFDEIQLFNVTQNTPEPTVNWPTLVAGSASGDPLADGVAALTLGRTGVSKRIGKKYFALFTEGALTLGLWTATTVTALTTAAADWIAPFTGISTATWDPGVFTRLTSAFTAFIEAVVSDIPAYQRRRKRGVGS